MHIPDSILDVKTAAVTGALAVGGLALALRQAKAHLPPKLVPLLGLSAAFVFVAQMLNFPVLFGASGHLMGGVLVAALLGPAAAVVVLTAVLIVQCFMFADGGVSALGANIFNIAIVGGVGGWMIYRLMTLMARGLFGRIVAATFAAWVSTVLAATVCAGQIAASGHIGLGKAVATMAGIHALIGVGEGIITALVLVAIARVRPELLGLKEDAQPLSAVSTSTRSLLGYGLLICLGLAIFVSPLASSRPDGLEHSAEQMGIEQSGSAAVSAPMADYQVPRLSEHTGTIVAGIVGVMVVFGFSWIVARILVRRPASE